jgi:hypothetical protein
MTQQEREILNTLATMPPHSNATINGCRVERRHWRFRVNGGEWVKGEKAAEIIARGGSESTDVK